MKTIKQRILTSFCLAVAVTIAIIGAAVSLKLNSSVSNQSRVMADYISGRIYRVGDSYNALLRTLVEDVKKEMYRSNKDLSEDPSLAKNIESQQLVPMASRLQTAAISSGADFIVVFDLQGRFQSSFPNPKSIDEKKVTDYYQSWELGARTRDRLKNKDATDERDLVSVTRHTPQILKDFGLDKFDITGKGGISIAAAGIIRDDFQDPIGICITGKLLNQHNGPLKQLYDATGAASLIYLENIPIAQAGFQNMGDAKLDETTLQISSEINEKIFKSDKTANMLLALAGNNYATSCSTLTATSGDKVAVLCSALPAQQIDEAQQLIYSYGNETKHGVQIWILAIGAVAMIAFVAVALKISKGIIRPISQAIQGLMEGSVQVAAASEQIAASSQSLAEGASEQASSLEESSSSLEEMASMTKQNAGNAGQADSLMKQANQVVNKANASMGQLTSSMHEITKASEETSKIIKTIDEIAFQTNLLALNAAVEAARAGQAGAGFAVVADEVRNLAKRAAEAAKNTEALIEGTVKKISEGTLLVKTTNDAFREVAGSTAKVGELVAEISAASSEQAQGIEQVNIAITEMDKITQQNAATAEESASASEEMNARAEEMKAFVGELAAMVGGNTAMTNDGSHTVSRPKSAGHAGQVSQKTPAVAHKPAKGKALTLQQRSREVNPDDIIPMDESDFKDF